MTGPGVRDPGLQPDRTDLAWRRTRLASAVAAMAVARHPLALTDGVSRLLVLVVTAVLAVVLLLPRTGRAATAGAVVMLAVAELAAIVVPTG